MEDEVRVLVVDDLPDAAHTLEAVLAAGGYTVRVAYSGGEALATVDAWRPHCVLLDVNMPGLDGVELARRFRRLFGDSIVLIAVTGGSEDDVLVKQAFNCVDHYLQKPDYVQALLKVLPPLNVHHGLKSAMRL